MKGYIVNIEKETLEMIIFAKFYIRLLTAN